MGSAEAKSPRIDGGGVRTTHKGFEFALQEGTATAGSDMSVSDRGRPRLSVSMIVRNEETFIEGCLQSVADLADEIVVVDTGSTDRTLSIVEQFRAKVVHIAWTDDFSAARNESLRHCSGDWILYLDADERVTPEACSEIRRVIARRDAAAFYCLLRSEEKLPDGVVHSLASYPRLFRRRAEFRLMRHLIVLPVSRYTALQ